MSVSLGKTKDPIVATFSQYPNGLTAAQVKSLIAGTLIYNVSPEVVFYDIAVSPVVGFVAFAAQSRQFSISAIYSTDGATFVTTGIQLTVTVSYEQDSALNDTTPPSVTFTQGNQIQIFSGQYTQSSFINTFFNISDPQSGIASVTLSQTINFNTVGFYTSVGLTATNGAGLTTTVSFNLTINAQPVITPPSLSGPNFIGVFTDQNLTDRTFIETYFTITTGTYTVTNWFVRTVDTNAAIIWTQPLTQRLVNVTVVDSVGNTATRQAELIISIRPPADTDNPQVTQFQFTINLLKSVYGNTITAQQITNIINNNFVVTDASPFVTSIEPTPTDWTSFGSRDYSFEAIDEFNNRSGKYFTTLNFNDDSDNIPPTISGPNVVTFIAGTNKTELDLIAEYTLSDNLDPNPTWFQLASFSFNQVGTYGYLLRARDASGNIASRSVFVVVVSPDTLTDTQPPQVSGPTSFRFKESAGATFATILPFYTVTDDVSSRDDIDYVATVLGSSIDENYVFPLGITVIALRFVDEAGNSSPILNVTVTVVDDEDVFDISEDITDIQKITANFKYSAPIVSYLDNGTWKPISWLVEPVVANYTIDQTSDEININFISNNLTSALKSGELVKVVYDSKSLNKQTWGISTYDERNRPTNHDVMIVESGSMVKIGNQSVYRHNYKLVELINVLKDYRIDSLSFTSFDKVTKTDAITGDTFTRYAIPYNALTILQRAIKQSSAFTVKEQSELIDLIRIVNVNTLSKEMIGVDEQFEEATLYDVVTKIGRTINRTPVLYLNPNFGSEDSAKYLLFYETDREHTKGVVTKESLIANATEIIENTLQNKGATQIVVDAKNLITSSSVTYPSEDMYAFAIGVEDEKTSVKDSPLKIILPYKISTVEIIRYFLYLEKRLVTNNNLVSGFPTYNGLTTFNTIDLPVMKYEDWLVLDVDERETTAYYKENTNEIFLPDNDTFKSDQYKAEVKDDELGIYVQKTHLYFQVDYFPIVNLSAKTGSGKQQTFNQTDSLVDSETLGKQVENYRKGNESTDITISKMCYSYDDMLKPTQLVNWDNELYHIVSVSFNSGKVDTKVAYKVAYQLNKEVRRNINVVAPDNIRNYQIPYDNVLERYTTIKDTAKLHFTTTYNTTANQWLSDFKYLQQVSISGTVISKYDYLLGGMLSPNPSVNTLAETVELVAFDTLSREYTAQNLSTFTVTTSQILTTPVKTLFGNSLLINFKMFDNINAGKRIFGFQGTLPSESDFEQRGVVYTGNFGQVDRMNIFYVWQNIESPADIVRVGENYPRIVDSVSYGQIAVNSLIRVDDYQVEKDSRETLNVTFQLEFEGVNGTKIAPDLVKYSSLYQTRQWTTIPFLVARLRNNFYQAGERITLADTITSFEVDAITKVDTNNAIRIILDDEYTFDTISNYALLEQIDVFNFKILAIMGTRPSLTITDVLYINY